MYIWYLCSELAEHTYTVNRFLALQPFHIVPHRLSQCQLVSEYSEGLTPSDSWHTQGLPPQDTHTHRPLHSIPPFPSDIGCHGDISQPVGMVTLPSPSQVTLAHPSTLPGGFCKCLMRMCVCEDAYLALLQTLWRCATTTLALPGPPVFFLYFFCYSVHLFTAFNRCLIGERRLQTVCTKYA